MDPNAFSLTRRITYKNQNYTITWDDAGIIDTVTRDIDGKALSTKDRIVKACIKHSDALRDYYIPFTMKFSGYTWGNQ